VEREQHDVKRLARVFKALSNPNRLQLFVNLLEESRLDLARGRTHDCFLARLLGDLDIGAPTVSHHVKELADAGLIDTERDGKQLVCSVKPDVMRELRELFSPGR
jgi:DNA-binding transcriptional ArsR family regulator